MWGIVRNISVFGSAGLIFLSVAIASQAEVISKGISTTQGNTSEVPIPINGNDDHLITDTNSLREKSLVSTLPMVIAQGQGVSVNVEKLNKAILAYNDLIDASSPEALQALSKNKEFIIIGDNLRKLRAALAI